MEMITWFLLKDILLHCDGKKLGLDVCFGKEANSSVGIILTRDTALGITELHTSRQYWNLRGKVRLKSNTANRIGFLVG